MSHQELQKHKHLSNSLEPKGYLWDNKSLKEKLKMDKLNKEKNNQLKKQAKNVGTLPKKL